MPTELATRSNGSMGLAPRADLYARLSAPMPTFQKDGRDYITGEACVARLNDVLGVGAWNFELQNVWYDREADCVMAHGRLTIRWPDGTTSVHEDIGSQPPNRRRAREGEHQGAILELGADYKGARTDCLKRCAVDVGVGLWLYRKSGGAQSAPASDMTPGRTPVAQAAKGQEPPGAWAAAPARRQQDGAERSAPSQAPAPPAEAVTSAHPMGSIEWLWDRWYETAARCDALGIEHQTPPGSASMAGLRSLINAAQKLIALHEMTPAAAPDGAVES